MCRADGGRAPMSLLQASVGALEALAVVLAFGRHARRPGGAGLRSTASVLISFAAGALMLRVTPPDASWPPSCRVALLLGCALAAASLLTLGPSFGVRPAARRLVTVGPYRWLRHPAYLGELMMLIACWAAIVSATPDGLLAVLSFGLIVVAVAAIADRVVAEERLLASLEGWSSYAASTRFRIVPGLW